MSSTSLMSVGSSALSANSAALQTIGNNIANANTPGYSRQTVLLQSGGGQMMGNGFYGKGVQVATVQRAHDDYLTREATLTKALQAADMARTTQLSQMEQVFPTGDAGLGSAVNSMLNAFATVATTPSDLSARTAVLSQTDEMTARMRTAQASIVDLQNGTAQQIQDAATSVNQIAKSIASLNDQISRVASLGQTPNDLMDQREQLISDMNKYVQTSTVPAADGTLSVFVAGSQPIVLGKTAGTMTFVKDPFDASQQRLAIATAGQTTAVNEAALGGGSIAGLMKFQNTDLVQARDLLGRMALTVADQVNTQNQLGLDLNGAPGGQLIALQPMPNAMPANTNTGNATISVTLANSTQLQASDYQINCNAGTFDIVRLSDGLTRSFASLPVQVDGLNMQVAAGATAVGDQFLVRPLHDVAGQVQTGVTNPSALAVANPVAATPAALNKGTATVSALAALQANVNLQAPVTLTFTGAGTFNVVGAGTGNPVGQAYVPGQPISFNGWQMTLTGQPAVGDTITIGPNAQYTNDSGNAQSMLTLRDKPAFDGAALTDGYANMLAQVGARVQGAQSASTVSTSIAASAEQARSSNAGVNLDEEAAKLLQYQQAYQASAKVLQVAQTIFTTLLQSFG